MKKILRGMQEKKQLIGIYINPNNTFGFIVGYVMEVDAEFFAFSMISETGMDDGVIILPICDIIKIEESSKYLNKIEKLISCRDSGCRSISPSIHGLIYGTLDFLKDKRILTSIGITSVQNHNREDTTGFIVAVDVNTCTVQKYSQYGLEDGVAYFELNRIKRIEYDTSYEVTLQRLIRILDNEKRIRH